MQILEIDWQRFLDDLPLFQRLERETRRLFLEIAHPSQPVHPFELGKHFEVLCASGFLVSGLKGQDAGVSPRYRTFWRIMGVLHRHRIFDFPSRNFFDAYLNRHFTRNERQALYGYHSYYYAEGNLYAQVSSIEWLKKFLTEPEKTRGLQDSFWGERRPLSPEVLRATQELVRRLMGRPSPVPLTELRHFWPEAGSGLLSPSLVAGLRSLLVFPALRGDNLEPVLGIWPSITKSLFRPTSKPPETVTPQQVFEAPLLMDDMALILALCAVEPFRLRTEDSGLFVRAENAINSALVTLPEWVGSKLNINTSERVDWAISFLKRYRFLEQLGERGQDLRLEVSEAGRRWLGLSAKERLKTILDGLLEKPKKRRELFHRVGEADYEDEYEYAYVYEYDKASLLPYSVGIEASKQDDAVRSAVLATYADAAAGPFMRLQEFLAYHSLKNNPLASVAQKQPYATLRLSNTYVSQPTPEELEDGWINLLQDFLRLRLFPLGAAKVGVANDGAVCFALTEAGRYLIGAQPDFRLEPAPGRIVVQPNFDVVFLAPAPRAESEIGCFAERKGHHMGTLFRITKRSILAAASAGMTAEQTFETLRQCCPGELPPNVRREISGWFAQCRQVSLRTAVLIHCPESETAARVQAVAGSNVIPVTDTILELRDRSAQAALVKKLREAGIFMSSYGPPSLDPERTEEFDEEPGDFDSGE